MGARGGYKPKDHEITDNFNEEKQGGLSKKELARAAGLAKGRAIILANRQEAIAQGLKMGKDGRPKDEPSEEISDDKAALQMLRDMRHVYKKVKGRDKLEKLMKSNKEFIFMVKELMKIEAAQLTAKIRAKEEIGGKSDRMVFVVLKGLEEEKGIRDMIDAPRDLKQSLIMNPDGSEYEPQAG